MINGLEADFLIRLPIDNTHLLELLCIRRDAALKIQSWYKSLKAKKKSEWLSFISSLSKFRLKAALCIQKCYKGFKARKDLSYLIGLDPKKLIRWSHEGHSVYIITNFTDPPWKELIPLTYSLHLKEFITTVLIDREVCKGTYCVKFLVDGSWMCDGNLPISQDQSGNLNNVILVNDHKNMISRAMSVRSFQSAASELNGHIKTQSMNSPIIIVRPMSGNFESPRGFGCLEAQNFKEPVNLVMAGYMIAKPMKQNSLLKERSADAWFIDHEKQSFGVADGVSEWSTFGLDPSKFPIELIEHCKDLLYEISEDEQEATDFLEKIALEASERTGSYGSSTILLAICRDSLLYTYCLGDSSFIILRKRDESNSLITVYRSVEQQHSFNCPFQLSNLPKPSCFDELTAKGLGSLVTLLKKSSKLMNDTPFDADNEMIPLKIGDIIIAGTDGLFDNLYDQEIIKTTEHALELKKKPAEFVKYLSNTLAEKAIAKGWDRNYRSPFARNAAKAGKKYMGGKLDDTTVIVAIGT